MSSGIQLRCQRFDWARAFLRAVAVAILLSGPAAAAETSCPAGQIAAGGECVNIKEAEAKLDAIVRTAMTKLKLKAVLVGVAVLGDSMTGVPATPDMHFRNGAVAIAYLGTVLLQLQDEGVLSIDDKLAKWFPEYPKAEQVTLQMLINGTSGYADYVTDDSFIKRFYANPFQYWTPDELIHIGLGRGMICDPGACWSYAHTNFVILGKVLEKATGRPLAELIRKRVLKPLSLENTRSEQTALIEEPVLHAFDAERGKYEESTYWNPSWTLVEGAVQTSNITAAAIGEGTLLSPDSHKLQLAPLTAKFKPWNERTYYGFGVFLINGWVVQNPSFAGYAATMAYLPAGKLAIAVSVTVNDGASLEGNLSTDVLKHIAAYLAPGAPM